MQFRYARNLALKDVEVIWEKPESAKWQSALYFENVKGLTLDNFVGGPARPQTDMPALVLNNVQDATIHNSQADSNTRVFLQVMGKTSHGIYLFGNELHDAGTPFLVNGDVPSGAVTAAQNF
jgi:hypothetical protein